MLNFFKENSYAVFKMIVNQIGMTIFGLVLSFATHQNNTLLLISSIFAVLFYLVLLYTMTWDIGFEEKIRIDGKRLKYNPLKGLYISLFANLINIVLGVLIVIGYYGATTFKDGFPYAPSWAVNLYGVPKELATLFEGMYSGIIAMVSKTSPWMYLLIVVPALVVCAVAYIAGVKGIHFTGLVGPIQKKD